MPQKYFQMLPAATREIHRTCPLSYLYLVIRWLFILRPHVVHSRKAFHHDRKAQRCCSQQSQVMNFIRGTARFQGTAGVTMHGASILATTATANLTRARVLSDNGPASAVAAPSASYAWKTLGYRF